MSNLMTLATGFGDLGRAGGWNGPSWVLFPCSRITVIATAIWLVARKRGPSSSIEWPLGILAARYARGEMDADEYHARHNEIRGMS